MRTRLMADEGKTVIIDGNILNVSPKNKRSANANDYFEEPVDQITNPIVHDRAAIRKLVDRARIAPDSDTARGIVIAIQDSISASNLIEFPDVRFYQPKEQNDENELKKYMICYVRLLPEDANDDYFLDLPNFLKQQYETGTASGTRMLPDSQDKRLISLHTKVLVKQPSSENGSFTVPTTGDLILLKFVDVNRRRAVMIGDGPVGKYKPAPPTEIDSSAVERFATNKGLEQTVGDRTALTESRSPEDIEDWKTGFNNQENTFVVPTTGQLTSPKQKFRELTQRPHSGIDIGCPIGSEVVAMAPGEISYTNPTNRGSSAGLYIEIDHSDVFEGFYTRYLHLEQVLVEPGTLVLAGDLIGYSGNTGPGTGPHLHFELRRGTPGIRTSVLKKSTAINPIPYLMRDPDFYFKLKIKSGKVYEQLIAEEDVNLTEEQLHEWYEYSFTSEVETGEAKKEDEWQSEDQTSDSGYADEYQTSDASS